MNYFYVVCINLFIFPAFGDGGGGGLGQFYHLHYSHPYLDYAKQFGSMKERERHQCHKCVTLSQN